VIKMLKHAGMLCAVAGLATASQAQLVVGNDQTTGAGIYEISVTGGPQRTLVQDGTAASQAWSMAFDSNSRTLYWTSNRALYKAQYTNTGSLTPVFIGTVTLDGISTAMQGLAFDSVANKLYATRALSANAGIYEISTTTAVATLVVELPDTDFGGFDYDAANDVFYVCNDSPLETTVLGRGIYRVAKPLTSPTFQRVGLNPSGDSDIDGLAVGGGNVYLINDVGSQGIYVFNLNRAAYDPSLPSPLGSGAVFSSGTYIYTPPASGADMEISMTESPDCSVPVGGTATYTVTVRNNGPTAASNVVMTFTAPTNASGINAVPAASSSAGNVRTFNLGSIANGATRLVTLTMTPTGGTMLANASVATSSTDNVAGNNATSQTTFLQPVVPSTVAAKAIISTIASAPTSDVPGLPGKFVNNGFVATRPWNSPDGNYWVQQWATSLETTKDVVLVQGGPGGLSVIAQTRTTELPTVQASSTDLPPYFPLLGFDGVQGVNDSGTYAFSGNDTRFGFFDDGYIVTKSDASPLTLFAQENVTAAPAAFGPDFLYGSLRGNLHLANNGSLAFFSTFISTLDSTEVGALVKDNGATIIAQQGVTVPTGQSGLPQPMSVFYAGTSSRGFFPNANHTNWIYTGELAGDTDFNQVAVVGSAVVAQENNVLPGSGFTSEVLSIAANRMEPNGDWLLRGSNVNGTDWVVRNGSVIAKTGDAITASSTETWSNGPFAGTFFLMMSNSNGDTLIGGTTNSGNPLRNTAVVLNGTTELLRMGDPVDVNGDGEFGDGFYVRTFVDDRCFMTNTHAYFTVRLRSEASQYCGQPDADAGLALIRVALPGGGCPCSADFDGSGGTPDSTDIDAFFTAWLLGDAPADADCSGGTPDSTDIDVFFTQWLNGGC
jgi:uncharacterized repeat protein (TIGR01451 family)